ncbi:MAG: helix-turn-helix domain-containing protein [Candidatus Methanomethylicaceae archaeon]
MVRFIDSAQACRRLKVSRITLHRYTKKGLLPFFRVGKELVFDSEVLKSFKRPKAGRPRTRKGGESHAI